MGTLNGQVSNTFTLLRYVADIACTLHTFCVLCHTISLVYKDLHCFCLLEWVTVAAGSVEVQARSQLRLCPHLRDIVD